MGFFLNVKVLSYSIQKRVRPNAKLDHIQINNHTNIISNIQLYN